ncbi:BspA family leucine-rich repeat surface protein [Persicobacter psychrovividus]|uniref:BspA family leucine-rich repeat surface protein n=1 Tax=Persicobacter psychrovividus TaxID=387638 RepID=A0ABM7VMC2_9BACT|nr:hypothetical protein PEPS_44410 [Persicobacter psychrovividus]
MKILYHVIVSVIILFFSLIVGCQSETEEPSPSPIYTISFVTNGGDEISEQEIESGQQLLVLPTPTKTDWVFDQWYLDETFNEVFELPKAIDKDITLYAKWLEHSPETAPEEYFTVTFNTQGGSDIAPLQVRKGKQATAPENPTKEGFAFAGWFNGEDLFHAFDFANASFDATAYAKWKPKDQALYFVAESGTKYYLVEKQVQDDTMTIIIQPNNAVGQPVDYLGPLQLASDDDLFVIENHAATTDFRTGFVSLSIDGQLMNINMMVKATLYLGSGLRDYIQTAMESKFVGPEGDYNYLDVSGMVDDQLSGTFYDLNSFNGDISKWDVSNATSLSNMFKDAESFNGDISKWDVSKVVSLTGIFEGASSFNQDLSKWDVSHVQHMDWAFKNATAFTHDLNSWDVSSANSMYEMFYGAEKFGKVPMHLAAWADKLGQRSINKSKMFTGSLFDEAEGYAAPCWYNNGNSTNHGCSSN